MKNKQWMGFLFVSPWLLGLVLFTIAPMGVAVYVSMTDWSIIGDSNFVLFENYTEIFQDKDFYKSLWITVRYALFAIPIKVIVALIAAVLLNTTLRGVGVFRTIFYMPAIVSGVAIAIVFRWVLDPHYGLINGILALVGVQGPNWLYDPAWVLPSYLITTLWGATGGLFIYLASLKDVPHELYESAIIDGVTWKEKLRYITLPLITPIIFYNIVLEIIGCFRKFTDAYIMGGAGGEGRFYMVHLYEQAFSFYRMGYATALAWILFVIILGLTIIVNVTKKYWVFSE